MLWLLELLWKATKLQSIFGFRLSWTFSGIKLRNCDCEQRLLNYRRFVELKLHRSQIYIFWKYVALKIMFTWIMRAKWVERLLVKRLLKELALKKGWCLRFRTDEHFLLQIRLW